jgi:hypothetical protein
MSAFRTLKRSSISLTALGFGLALAATAPAAPPPQSKPPCGTSGAVEMTDVAPGLYSYTSTAAGQEDFEFVLSSPSLQRNPSCDSSLPYVFGNGKGGLDTLPLSISVSGIEENGAPVSPSTDTALRAGLTAFATAPFELTPPGTGSQKITFSFINTSAVPAGEYDVTITVAHAVTGVQGFGGVDSASKTFVIKVEEPQDVDALPPVVGFVAPVANQVIKLNSALDIGFTAEDPEENGVGTGVRDMRAKVATSCNDAFYSLTPLLGVVPALPVAAGVQTSGTASVVPWLSVGTFTVTAEADDAAGHTGQASVTFTAGVNLDALPPISVPNRQFNTGSTVPIKFVFRDADGALLPPMDGLVVRIKAPTAGSEDRVAGDGAGNVRWDVDEYGFVTQYITNYTIVENGTYTVEILLTDTCGDEASQGSFTFAAASKGGKTK